MKLENKIALVTGASTGIGVATVKKFLAEGATVYGTGIKSDKVSDITGKFTFIPCDVTNPKEIENVCGRIEDEQGKLDILVTVAEKLFRGGITEVSPCDIEEANKHILIAPMLFTKYCNNMLHKSDNGAILHNVPISAYMIEKDYLNASYNTALVNYVRQCSSQIRPVRVNAILFGIMKDHLMTPDEIAVYEMPERLVKIPAGRIGESIDVANVTAFLASDKARYLNSGAWTVDGGYYTMNARAVGNNGI